ncbi:MAG: bacteriohemerythrin [Methyloprofundus sp.]|nr:bacteriohemerythrin [Methyloprofundus sp.]
MDKFIWQDSYNIGNSTIDSQHKYLFELANKVVAATSKDQISECLMLLYKYTREHFQAEEAVMKIHSYPEYNTHVYLHNKMLDKLIKISDSLNTPHWNKAMIDVFMQEWLLVHILEKDMPLGAYIKTK